ncbi:MAG: helix-turn-helix domain-containing protein [Bdellovibrionota bacterium]
MSEPLQSKLFDNLFVDRKALSKIINIAPSTISKLMAEDGLPYYKIGKCCRYKVAEVMAFLEERKRP